MVFALGRRLAGAAADRERPQFSVSASGALLAAPIAPVATGSEPWNITLSPDGKYAYVSAHGNGAPPGTVSEYSIGSDGTLTLIGAETAGLSFFMIATAY
jgi:DNA-binding beta-propeller fold protein YncE